MYQALYRKYRPSDFSGVIGQPQVVRTLRNQVSEGRISHAYLFTGSRGTGKTSCAKILAKAVNCLNSDNGNPCNECAVCRGINDETILDIVEIDAASNNGVDNIRELREATAFTPAAAKYRVYIIDEVHMLSGAAFNALLKTLEEPPEHVIFILATTEVHKLPATILSRCQRYDFRRISAEDIADRIEFIASKEPFNITRDAAVLIGKLSDGAMRDALSLLDVCSTQSEITEQTVLDAAGLSGRAYLHDLLAACFSGDTAAALDMIDKMYAAAKDFGRLCAEAVEYLRDMMLIKTLREPEKLLSCSQGELEQIGELARGIRLDMIIHAMELFESTAEKMRSGAERRIAVERAVIMLCEPSLDSSVEALNRRIAALEVGAPKVQSIPVVTEAVPTKMAAPEVKAEPVYAEPERETAAAVETPKPEVTDGVKSEPKSSEPAVIPEAQGVSDGATPFDRWNEVIAAVGKTDRLMKAALGGSEAFIQGEYMLLRIKNESFRDTINGDARHRANLKNAIALVTGYNYKIGPYKEPEKPKYSADDPLEKLIKIAEENNIPKKP